MIINDAQMVIGWLLSGGTVVKTNDVVIMRYTAILPHAGTLST